MARLIPRPEDAALFSAFIPLAFHLSWSELAPSLDLEERLAAGARLDLPGDPLGTTVIGALARGGRDRLLRRLLPLVTDVDAPSCATLHSPPLIQAIMAGHDRAALVLLQHGADPYQENYHHHSAVALAAVHHCPLTLLRMHRDGVDFNRRDSQQRVPLTQLCENYHMQAGALLIALGADPLMRLEADMTQPSYRQSNKTWMDLQGSHAALPDLLAEAKALHTGRQLRKELLRELTDLEARPVVRPRF